jgi:hypothetical protein
VKQLHVLHAARHIGLAAIVFAGLTITVYAQMRGSGRMGAPLYNTSTEVTVKGTVEAVTQVTGPNGWGGTHLTVRTKTETLDVHLGPSWYLTQNKVSFSRGDKIKILGSKVKFNDRDVLLAREVSKGGKKVVLRDANGFPEWSRGRR